MSIAVALTDLPQALGSYDFAYLLSAGTSEGGAPRVLAVRPHLREGVLCVSGLGERSCASIAQRPAVNLTWPPQKEDGYSLIVDGTAVLDAEQPGSVRITPGHAVLHRPAPRPKDQRAPRFPFAKLIGLRFDAQGEGKSTLSLPILPKHLNPNGVVHGGVTYALADTGMGTALQATLEPGQICATIDIGMHYHKPVMGGRLVCHTELLTRGKTVGHLRSTLFIGDKLVASASGNFAIFARPDKVQ